MMPPPCLSAPRDRQALFSAAHLWCRYVYASQWLLRGPVSHLNGDALVMGMGSFAAYVNMRNRDTILADWLIKVG
jgi:hypothetical protein